MSVDSALAEIASLNWLLGFLTESCPGEWQANLLYRYPGPNGLAICAFGKGTTAIEALDEAILDIPNAIETPPQPTCYMLERGVDEVLAILTQPTERDIAFKRRL